MSAHDTRQRRMAERKVKRLALESMACHTQHILAGWSPAGRPADVTPEEWDAVAVELRRLQVDLLDRAEQLLGDPEPLRETTDYLKHVEGPKRPKDWKGKKVRLKKTTQTCGGTTFEAGSVMTVWRCHAGRLDLDMEIAGVEKSIRGVFIREVEYIG